MENNLVSPMELVTMLHRSNNDDIGLTVHHRLMLTTLLCHVNKDLSGGYKAWPSTATIERLTGMNAKTIERARKALLDGKWLTQIIPAKGPGHSCIYYVNAQRIIEVASKAGQTTQRKAAKSRPIDVKPTHERNTSGLNRGKMPAKQIDPVPNWYDDDNEEDYPF